MTTILDLWEMLNTIEAGTAPNCTATLRASSKMHTLMPPTFTVEVRGVAKPSKTMVYAEETVTLELLRDNPQVPKWLAQRMIQRWVKERESLFELLKQAGGTNG